MPQADIADFVPAAIVHIPSVHDIEKAKSSSEHVEEIDDSNENRPVVYTEGEDDSKPRTGLRRLLRKNPSLDFIKEVAEENKKELDPVEVGRVERKLFWLIVPALAVDYAFYYVRRALSDS